MRCCDVLRQAAELIQARFTFCMSNQQQSCRLTHLCTMDSIRTSIAYNSTIHLQVLPGLLPRLHSPSF